MNTIPYALSRL